MHLSTCSERPFLKSKRKIHKQKDETRGILFFPDGTDGEPVVTIAGTQVNIVGKEDDTLRTSRAILFDGRRPVEAVDTRIFKVSTVPVACCKLAIFGGFPKSGFYSLASKAASAAVAEKGERKGR